MNGARVMTRRQTTEVGDILEAVRQKQKQGSPILRYVRCEREANELLVYFNCSSHFNIGMALI